MNNLIAYDGQIELDEDDWADDHDPDDGDEEDEWGCEFGDLCLMPSYDHLRSECYTKEMAEAWMDEQNSPA